MLRVPREHTVLCLFWGMTVLIVVRGNGVGVGGKGMVRWVRGVRQARYRGAQPVLPLDLKGALFVVNR